LEKNSPITIEFMDEKLGDFGLPCAHVPFVWLVRLNNHLITNAKFLSMPHPK
jgi:hypothetical protein